MSDKPVGYMTRLLGLDMETTGLAYNADDPSFNPRTKEYYQPVSVGLIVVDADTLKTIEELYIEIKWDGKSVWNKKAEQVHGLTKEYLQEHGVTYEDAVVQIGNLLLDHWGPDSPIHILGHNPWFDLCFFRRLMRTQDIDLKFGNKMIDTNSLGFAVFGTYNSTDLFDMIGVRHSSGKHNALTDARNSVEVVRRTRMLADQCFGG